LPREIKDFVVAGKTFKISGNTEDVYFQFLSATDGLNDLALRICEKWEDPRAVVLDVGANIGFTASMFANEAPQGKIYCFEPSPKVYSQLQDNISLNAFSNCETYQLGVGKKLGSLGFFDDPNSASASHIVQLESPLNIPNQLIEITTIDHFAEIHGLDRLDLIKIDVEGFELDVLLGAATSLERFKPKVYLEFNSFTLIAYGNLNPRHFLEQLIAIFPHVYTIMDGVFSEIRTPASILGFIHANLLRCHCVNDLLCAYEPVVLG
jgi:FkbM family methyltransferase